MSKQTTLDQMFSRRTKPDDTDTDVEDEEYTDDSIPPQDVEYLREYYQHTPHPSEDDLRDLCMSFGIEIEKIEAWFHRENVKRAALKRSRTVTDDDDVLKFPTAHKRKSWEPKESLSAADESPDPIFASGPYLASRQSRKSQNPRHALTVRPGPNQVELTPKGSGPKIQILKALGSKSQGRTPKYAMENLDHASLLQKIQAMSVEQDRLHAQHRKDQQDMEKWCGLYQKLRREADTKAQNAHIALTDQVRTLQTILEDKENELAQKNRRIDALTGDREVEDKDRRSLYRRLQERTRQCRELRDTFVSFDDYLKMIKDLEQKTIEARSLQIELETAEKNLERANAYIRSLSQEKSTLVRRLIEGKTTLEQYESLLGSMSEQLSNDVEPDVGDMQKRLAVLNRAYMKSQKELEEAQKELNLLKMNPESETILQLKAEAEKVPRLSDSLEKAEASCKDLELQIERSLKPAQDELKDELKGVRNTNRFFVDQIGLHKTKIESLARDLDQTKLALAKRDKTIEYLHEELESVNAAGPVSQEEYDDVTAKLRRRNQDVREANDKIQQEKLYNRRLEEELQTYYLKALHPSSGEEEEEYE